MIGTLLRHVEQQYLRTDIPDFRIGDRVEVHQRILDGPKERIQVFEGDVIARQHDGVRETFTVRRIVQGEGVERIFPLHSPPRLPLLRGVAVSGSAGGCAGLRERSCR